jgi:hypothetical protein
MGGFGCGSGGSFLPAAKLGKGSSSCTEPIRLPVEEHFFDHAGLLPRLRFRFQQSRTRRLPSPN